MLRHRTNGAACRGIVAVLAAAALLGAPSVAHARTAFDYQGMWIWYVSQAEHGALDKIAIKARRRHVGTLFIKSSDGTSWWSQFDSAIGPLHQLGFRVCAWQYVYGKNPTAEAALGARAAAAGADCLVIDAESEYANKYAAATTYMTSLRAQVGSHFQVGLTSFAYPDFHGDFPYSAFLGPGGAQWNLPQMYFHAFRQPISAVFAHTWGNNQIYRRRIYPIGQTYGGVTGRQVAQFRRYARAYRARNVSWWVWQDTTPSAWRAIGKRLRSKHTRHTPRPRPWPVLKYGYSSDLVRWAQMHLQAAGAATLVVDGRFRASTTAAVKTFQQAQGLPVTAQVDGPTWRALLRVRLHAPPANTNGPTGGGNGAGGAAAADVARRHRGMSAGL